jgi:hypothetical protein
MPTQSPPELESFSRALEQVLYDLGLQSTGAILKCYFDADVVVRLIFGFDHNFKDNTPPTADEELVRAMLFSGVLSLDINLLPPHAVELEGLLNKRSLQKDVLPYNERLRQYLERRDAAQVYNTLVELRAAKDGADVPYVFESLEARFSEAKLLDIFVALAEAVGPWPNRLKELLLQHRMLFSKASYSIEELSSGPVYKVFLDEAQTRRPLSSVSNVRDALALAELHLYISGANASAKLVPIFYTESHTVYTIIQHNEMLLRALGSMDKQGRSHSVLRTPGYFRLLATLPELSAATPDQLAEWSEFSTLVSGLVASQPGIPSKTLNEFASSSLPNGKSLAECLEDWRNLRLLARLPATDPKSSGGSFIRKLYRAWERYFSAYDQDEISASADSAFQELKEATQFFVRWKRDVEQLTSAVNFYSAPSLSSRLHTGTFKISTANERSTTTREISVYRDFGLVRWPSTLELEGVSQIHKLFSEFAMQRRKPKAEAELVSKLSWRIQECYEQNTFDFQLCITLSQLQCYEVLDRLLSEELSYRHEYDRYTHRLIYAGAECQLANSPNDPELLTDLFQEDPVFPHDSMYLRWRLGLAFIGIMAFQKYLRHDGHLAVAKGFLEQAKDCSVFVCESTSDDLPNAFATNYCLYAGSLLMSTQTRENLDEDNYYLCLNWARELEQLRGGSHWHYRFADSLAYFYLQIAKSDSELLTKKSSLWWVRKSHGLIDECFDYGDDEVRKHRLEIGLLHQQLEAQHKLAR